MEEKQTNHKKKEIRGLAYNFAFTVVATLVLILTLQPFKIDQVTDHKYLLIMGYAILAGITCLLSDLIASLSLRCSVNDQSARFMVIRGLLMTPIMGAFVSCYASYFFTGTIRNGWYDWEGHFTLTSFVINSGYSLIVGGFVTLFAYYYNRSHTLAKHLQEERKLNAILAERAANNAPTPSSAAATLTLKGNSKEMLTIATDELLYIESDANYAQIHYLKEGVITKKMLRCTLKQLEEMTANETSIIRCHRAYIVNLKHVKHVEGNTQGYKLTLNHTSEQVPVSRAFATPVYQRLSDHQLG